MILAFLIFVLCAGRVHAGFDAFYMVDASGSTAPKTTFDWNDTPWIYVKLPTSGFYFEVNWMNSPTGDNYGLSIMSSSQELWISAESGYGGNKFINAGTSAEVTWLNDMREEGDWNVMGSYLYANGASGSGSTTFTVTPEPISFILFLAGGAVLGVRRFLNNKN
ncbi:MAG: hypothetical protein HZC49_12730 [Nitrospirae bacterium]|nr:hypothetical protein [Nitrospirota bacterium]